jgi:nicotinamidase/pyrazinamidase
MRRRSGGRDDAGRSSAARPVGRQVAARAPGAPRWSTLVADPARSPAARVNAMPVPDIDPDRDLLLVIDLQNDFCPGGALAVADGDAIVPVVNRLAAAFAHVALTQDWHPAGHRSFASAHHGHAPFASLRFPYGDQTLWPDHCVQGTPGAAFHPELDATRAEIVIRKGFRPAVDSYSAFFENDRITPTGLGGYLRERGFGRVVMCGLATDFCVAYSALDARRLGFETIVRLDACRAIDLGGSLAAALGAMRDAGVVLDDGRS